MAARREGGGLEWEGRGEDGRGEGEDGSREERMCGGRGGWKEGGEDERGRRGWKEGIEDGRGEERLRGGGREEKE